ncbi:hypothetical protein ACJ73_07562, partial [Blastomyces percursus]
MHGIVVTNSPSNGQANATNGNPSNAPSSSHTNIIYKSTTQALKKWKRVWDEDMSTQYPPSPTSTRRFGFCRDAIPYYWLAQALLWPSRQNDWKLIRDARLIHIMTMLQNVRGYAQTDAAQRGEGLGSISDIDDGYAIVDLTLDMKLLFRPIRQQFEGDICFQRIWGLHATAPITEWVFRVRLTVSLVQYHQVQGRQGKPSGKNKAPKQTQA